MSDPVPPDMGNTPMPRHVAFIMDGNGRWAKAQGLDRTEGHRRGVERVREILECCRSWNIPYATLYAFSTENWKRPEYEINVLFSLMVEYLEKETPRFLRDNIRLHIVGDPDALPDKARASLERTLEQTRHCDRWHVLLAVNYGGRNEIVRAVRKITASGIPADQVTDTVISDHMDTAGIPDPDLMIRTSGEQRISNFLLWQLAYTEFMFIDPCWPEFGADLFRDALEQYARRDRRFGLTGDQVDGPQAQQS